ncbi:MAG: hypothetical protein ACXADY_17830 [Candidatus Hodarchaeales archaeon]
MTKNLKRNETTRQSISKLNQYEENFINCFIRFFEYRGRPSALGLVFGLLFAKAPSSRTGLSQTEITKFIGKSKSSISRALEQLSEQGFCSYILEDNEIARAERKYYINGSFKELTISRTKKSLNENNFLKKDLEQITKTIPLHERKQNQMLVTIIDQFCDLIDILKLTHEKTLEILQQHYKDED